MHRLGEVCEIIRVPRERERERERDRETGAKHVIMLEMEEMKIQTMENFVPESKSRTAHFLSIV